MKKLIILIVVGIKSFAFAGGVFDGLGKVQGATIITITVHGEELLRGPADFDTCNTNLKKVEDVIVAIKGVILTSSGQCYASRDLTNSAVAVVNFVR